MRYQASRDGTRVSSTLGSRGGEEARCRPGCRRALAEPPKPTFHLSSYRGGALSKCFEWLLDTPCCSGSQTQGRGSQAWGRSAKCWGCRVRLGVICPRTCLGARADLAKCSSKGPWVVAQHPLPGSDTPEVGNQGQVTQPWFRWHGQPSGDFFSPTTAGEVPVGHADVLHRAAVIG